jgi:hypothetical protein
MMTINKFVTECILPNFDGFGYQKSVLFKAPIDDILSGFYLEKVKDNFYIWCFFQPLYIPSKSINFTFGKRLGQSTKKFIFDELNTSELKNEIIEEMNKHMTLLKSIKNASDFYHHFKKSKESFNTLEGLVLTSCFINHKHSDQDLLELISKIELLQNSNAQWNPAILEISKQLYHSNQTERKELFELWRLDTLKELGLSKWAAAQ